MYIAKMQFNVAVLRSFISVITLVSTSYQRTSVQGHINKTQLTVGNAKVFKSGALCQVC